MAKDLLKVYLAGPMTNGSERQKTVWRKRVEDALKTEFKCLDPTDRMLARVTNPLATALSRNRAWFLRYPI
jgi:hypothetical protein